MTVSGKPVRASVLLQMLYYITLFYFVFFVGCEIFLLIYKSIYIGYPSNLLALDSCFLVLMVPVEIIQSFLGSKGNLTEHTPTLGSGFLFLVGAMFLTLYFIVWQTYVVRLDIIVAAILLGLHALQLFFSIISMVDFATGITLARS